MVYKMIKEFHYLESMICCAWWEINGVERCQETNLLKDKSFVSIVGYNVTCSSTFIYCKVLKLEIYRSVTYLDCIKQFVSLKRLKIGKILDNNKNNNQNKLTFKNNIILYLLCIVDTFYTILCHDSKNKKNYVVFYDTNLIY